MPDARRPIGETCARQRQDEGQSLAEFALILPLFMVMLMGLIEFSLAFNANLGVNQASQNGALLASQAGNSLGADCLILERIERDVTVPADRARIREVQIQRTNPSGSIVMATNRYDRSGSLSCDLIDGRRITVPYRVLQTTYPEAQRCNVIAGCPMMAPPHSSVDTIGVQIEYRYAWMTPLGSLLPFIGGDGPSGPGYTFQKRNVFRMEPVL
jgi:Flp pilus assembly protein TadG